jgi:D-alanyl-D-alanine carboxypeptidase
MMTEKARELGMTRTRWRNPNGLPDEAQVTTARDLAMLGEALFRDHPTYYSYFSATEFRYGNVTYRNHNRLLEGMDGVTGVDGIKTGYIRAAGYNLVTSAERDGHRVVAVVLGGSTSRVRDSHMADLVEQAFVAMEENPEEPVLVATLTPEGAPVSHIKGAPVAPDEETLRANAIEQEQNIALASLELSQPAEQGDALTDRGVRIVFSEDAGQPAPEEATGDSSNAVQPVVLRMPAEKEPGPEDRREPALRAASRAESEDDFGGWQIQVGAYRDQETAMSRLAQLEAMAISVLAGAATRVENATIDDANWYRARFAGLTEGAAREACATLASAGDNCFPVAPN